MKTLNSTNSILRVLVALLAVAAFVALVSGVFAGNALAKPPEPRIAADTVEAEVAEAPAEASVEAEAIAEAAPAVEAEQSAGLAESLAEETAEAAEETSGDLAEQPSVEAAPLVEEPSLTPIIPEDRPEWVSAPADRKGELQTVAVSSDPFESVGECRQDLKDKMVEATNNYIDEYVGYNGAARLIGLRLDTVESRLVRQRHEDEIIVSVGPMHQAHALLEFDEGFRRDLARQWREVTANWRLLQTGLIAFGVLAVVAVAFGFFRYDTATRGYYSGWLKLGAVGLLAALAAAGFIAARWIHWI